MNSYPNLNVVIPMAGEGKRFKDAGYTQSKPFIDVLGKPMILAVLDNFTLEGRYIIVTVKGFKTQGATETVLLVEDQINNENPLVIASCDQLFYTLPNWIDYFKDLDGGLLTFESSHPKWSFIEVKDGLVIRVAEKEPISNHANVGVYYWKRGSDFVKYAHQMIDKNIRVNNEFYNALVYNEAIADGKKIGHLDVDKMVSLGTPEDLESYVKSR